MLHFKGVIRAKKRLTCLVTNEKLGKEIRKKKLTIIKPSHHREPKAIPEANAQKQADNSINIESSQIGVALFRRSVRQRKTPLDLDYKMQQ